MTWKEIRTAVLNLGFEKNKTYEKNKQAYINAYNWRQRLIASTIGGVVEQIGVGCSGQHRHIFDLYQLRNGYGMEFVAVAQTGVLDTFNREVTGWKLTDNRFFSLPEGYEGNCIVNVLVLPADINEQTEDTNNCPLPVKWRNIMPYLMANRLYLEDDAAKRGYYWNQFVEMRDALLEKERTVKAVVTGGVDIDGWQI